MRSVKETGLFHFIDLKVSHILTGLVFSVL